MAEVVAFGDLLHLRPGVGDGDKAAAGFVGTDGLLHALEEILLVDVGLERAAGFAGHDEKRLREIDLLFDVADLRRVGRIEDVEAREAGCLRVGQRRALRGKGSIRPCRAEECRRIRPP